MVPVVDNLFEAALLHTHRGEILLPLGVREAGHIFFQLGAQLYELRIVLVGQFTHLLYVLVVVDQVLFVYIGDVDHLLARDKAQLAVECLVGLVAGVREGCNGQPLFELLLERLCYLQLRLQLAVALGLAPAGRACARVAAGRPGSIRD